MASSIIGVIGGSGLYQMAGLERVREVSVTTPFGKPSDKLVRGKLGDTELMFLPRHGKGHRWLPTEVNFRANIFALKKLGVERIISVSAVGSLREKIAPGHVVVPDQFIDRTTQRPSTFFGKGIVAHVIGMTNLQEAKLAREAEICFGTLALATDYDCWNESAGDVEIEHVLAVLKNNVDLAQRTIRRAVAKLGEPRSCACASALKDAIITERSRIPKKLRVDLRPIIGKYL
jgi:5'-methylthioadenosine phosphorylase